MGTRVGRKLFWQATGVVMYECPGCGMMHALPVEKQNTPGPVWSWNGSGDAPMFSPSVLVQYDCMSPEGRKQSQDFYKEHGRYPDHVEHPYDTHHVCHSYVGCNGAEPGYIKFLDDCTHALKGQTVAMPDMED